MAYCLRFIHNCRFKDSLYQGALSPSELNEAALLCVRHAQNDSFMKEKTDLVRKGLISPKSSLLSLNPFLDRYQCLRVGGRLQNIELSFDQQHPMILPKRHHITTLIIEDLHTKNLHANGQLLLSLLRQRFWIPDGRNVVRKVIRKCLICFRLKTSTAKQLMGQLSGERVTPTRPFTNTGVDYAGPFYLKQGRQCSKSVTKGYIALFVCLSTKAIHLELVPDLSSEAYIAALRCFTARRGLRNNIYSDNGTNFVGAEREIRRTMLDKEFLETLKFMVAIKELSFTLCPLALLTWVVCGKLE